VTDDNVVYLGTASALPSREDRDWVTSHELATEARITYRRLDYWTRVHLLTPLDVPTPGTGHLRRYSADQVTRATILRDLYDLGLSRDIVLQILDPITRTGHATVGPITIHRPDPGGNAA
jgi:hypothetical protein